MKSMNAPAPTAAMLATFHHFESIARETGATVELSRSRDGYWSILETFEGETMAWNLYSDGTAELA